MNWGLSETLKNLHEKFQKIPISTEMPSEKQLRFRADDDAEKGKCNLVLEYFQ